ncbi:DivIVA domain-containing protein [Zhihengliuella flava]|uniref:Cell wall synthesis protein Wag31 n=1 Tax=Zhihengliuella flava TaxID=1285193 RepID=A0A931DEV2_9MICC|nr:DivIVA domain-containing protein [Zhihengliuella flava]MBG6085545.1 DivIVA domain-containing protein [Zhihengliuella flava]
MEYVLLLLALGVLGVTALAVIGRRTSGPRGLGPATTSLPPVVLPESPREADISAVRFSVALRGYRCDQVDETLDHLAQEIERLNHELEAARRQPHGTTKQ